MVLLDGLSFPECPHWRCDRLWFSDEFDGVVRTVDLAGHSETVVAVPGDPLGLGWSPDGDLLVVSSQRRRVLRLADNGLQEVADLRALARGFCNDMVIDRAGRAYVGHFGYDLYGGEQPVDASLILVTFDGRHRTVAHDLNFPNGCVITPDSGTLIIAETSASRLSAFDIDEDGSLSRRRIFATLGSVRPDGICLDAEGMIWVGSPLTSEFIRVAEGGDIVDRVPVPGRAAISCTLGGNDGQTMFMCTAHTSMEQVLRRESVGFIEVMRVDVPGAFG